MEEEEEEELSFRCCITMEREEDIFFSIYYGSTYGKGRESMTSRIFCPLWNAYIFWGKCCMSVFFVKEVPTFLEALTFSFRNRKCETSTTTTRASVNLKVKEIFQVFQNWTKLFSRTNFPGIFFVLCWISFLRVIERVSAKKEQWTQKKEFSLFFFPSSTSLCFPEKEEEHYSFVSSSSFQASHNGISLALLLLWKGMGRMCCVRPVFLKCWKW